ncbi:hypothetical protein ACFU93_32555 [Streptomyces sp. NPDC057611]
MTTGWKMRPIGLPDAHLPDTSKPVWQCRAYVTAAEHLSPQCPATLRY